jgi:hypothetical protein
MELSDRDKEIVKGYVDRGEPLPAKYKLLLFKDAPEVELVWQGKTSEVTNVVLPFQSIEHIDEPRAEVHSKEGNVKAQTGLEFASDARGRQSSGWTNKLIWGDNKLAPPLTRRRRRPQASLYRPAFRRRRRLLV